MRSVTFEALWRDGPVNAQPGAPPGRKIHWDADESVVFVLQHASLQQDEKDSEHADASEVTPPTQ